MWVNNQKKQMKQYLRNRRESVANSQATSMFTVVKSRRQSVDVSVVGDVDVREKKRLTELVESLQNQLR